MLLGGITSNGAGADGTGLGCVRISYSYSFDLVGITGQRSRAAQQNHAHAAGGRVDSAETTPTKRFNSL